MILPPLVFLGRLTTNIDLAKQNDKSFKTLTPHLVRRQFIKAAIHQMAFSLNASNFENCKQNFSRPSRSKVMNDLVRVSRNEMAKILDPQNNHP